MDGVGIGQTGRSAARRTRTSAPSPTQLKVLRRARAERPRTKLCHKSRQPGGNGFCESAENSDQYRAIDQLTEMHVTKAPYLPSTLLKHEQHSRALNTAHVP